MVPASFPLPPGPMTLPSESIVSLPPESALRGQQFPFQIGAHRDYDTIPLGDRKICLQVNRIPWLRAARGDAVLKDNPDARSRRYGDSIAGGDLRRRLLGHRHNRRWGSGLRPFRLLSKQAKRQRERD